MIALADVEQPLALFAEGMNGAHLHIKPGDPLRVGPSDVLQTGSALHLPEAIDAAEPGIYRALALQQIARREFGGIGFSLRTAYARLPTLDRLPKPQALARPSDRWLFYHHFPNPHLAAELFEAFERVRIDAAMCRAYPGIRPHLAACQRHWQRSELAPGPAARSLLRFQLGEPAADAMSQVLHPLAQGLLAPSADIYDAAAATQNALVLLVAEPGGALEDPPALEATAAEWAEREARLKDWEEELRQADGHLLAAEMLESEQLEAARTEGSGGEVREEQLDIKRIRAERDQLARRIGLERSAVRDALGDGNAGARSYRYDEWDFHRRGYRRNWCRLFEQPLSPGDDADVDAIRQAINAWHRQARQLLEQIKPQGYCRRWGLPDGDEIDLNAVVAARQDLRAGRSPSERLYSRREKTHRDVCAALLLDLSASTDDPLEADTPAPPPDSNGHSAPPTPNLRDPFDDAGTLWSGGGESPAPPKRRIIDVQKEAAAILAAALERLGDSYGIYGFSGYGRDCVEFYVAKDLRQTLNARTLAAIAAMQPKRSTRMGPAIRHAVRKLANSGNALKVLLVISDGFPQDCDYGPVRGDREYGLHDTAKALAEAASKGIETFCVTVDRSGHDYLKRMCPQARYAVIEELEDLPQALTKVYAALTG
ncbi:MAG: VWA domain-containing protein [Gammaproteobacteria bacterium]|nr:VWA domain-containing protein [Gammaproteobacteria bacterium]MCY4343854.1 VWA domain-containing protein [Gammaproteobacteria bacterium]